MFVMAGRFAMRSMQPIVRVRYATIVSRGYPRPRDA
jgi:hypothetical protein